MTETTTTTSEPEAGPGGFDPGEPFVPEQGPNVEHVEPVRVDVRAVKAALKATTRAANDLAGERALANLEMSELEASLIAPGVVRYLEARPRLAAAAVAGGNDYLKAAVGFGVYGVRVARERAAAIAALEAGDAARGADELRTSIDVEPFGEA